MSLQDTRLCNLAGLPADEDYRVEQGGTALYSPSYVLLPADLRDFTTFAPSLLQAATSSSSIGGHPPALSPHLPTLLLVECVLVYLPPTAVDNILLWFSSTFAPVGGLSIGYDPFGLHDSFGQVMIRNLAVSHHGPPQSVDCLFYVCLQMRDLVLPSVEATHDLDSLSQRLLKAKFSDAKSITLRAIRDDIIPATEVKR